MACSKYEYVKKFEIHQQLLPNTFLIVRVDGKGFTKFTKSHNFEKPNDFRALDLMNKCAAKVVETFSEIFLAYGQSDEYSFAFLKNTQLYQRRAEKIVSTITSCFSSCYTLYFQEFFGTQPDEIPIFDGRIVMYPTFKNLKDYFSWRQVDCHINNLYNTCFWKLVKEKSQTNQEAEKTLKVMNSGQKNELLFQVFGINYNNEKEIAKKGTVILKTQQLEIYPQTEESKEEVLSKKQEILQENQEKQKKKKKEKSKPKKDIQILHVDLIKDDFWKKYQNNLELQDEII